ncbi:P-loop containing nucleoside triphosphate hydrolase protein [Lipomyces doorenjongii]
MAVVQRADGPHDGATSGVLGFIFPPMGYVFYIQENARYERATMAMSLTHVAPEGYTAPGIYWIGAIVQAVAYLYLGMASERVLYGGQLRTTSDSVHDECALTLSHVTKTYKLFTFLGLFVPSKRLAPIEAVKDLSISFRTGELSCLLGANGSGRTTTLEMIAGIQKPSSGTIIFGSSTELGICPQRNVMWDDLTVEEHVRIWDKLKAARRATKKDVADLVTACDLTSKMKFLSKNLSGGQKRKLQLAMMFAGGSKVCCVDEVSSGLDPLSRRRIWDILLASRGQRTIILTTHFLDEADLLADSIAILARGELVVAGSPLKLKADFGNGYRVYSIMPASGKEMVYEAENGNQVISLVNRLEREEHKELRVSGPQLEDVFLKFVADSDAEIQELLKENDVVYQDDDEMSKDAVLTFEASGDLDLKAGVIVGLWGQISTMIRKRLIVTRSHPFPMVCIVLIPIVVGGIVTRFLKSYEVSVQGYESFSLSVFMDSINMIFGPQSTVMEYLPGVSIYLAVSTSPSNTSEYPDLSSAIIFEQTFAEFVDAVHTNYSTLLPGGIYFNSPVTLSYRVDGGTSFSSASDGIIFGPIVLNMVNNIRANGTTTIITNYSPFQYPWVSTMGDHCTMGSYPAFCALYPTVERLHRVRALHYSNGLRVLPLWAAYLLYDFCFALLASLILAGILPGTNSNWFGLGYLFTVLVLYGIASILLAFVISMIAKSQLAAFALTAAYQCCYFLIYLIAYLSVNTFVTVNKIDETLEILYYVMGAFAPITNLIKALFLSVNLFNSICNGDTVYSYYGDIGAYGSPILYLVLQALILFGMLIWWDSGFFRDSIRRRKSRADTDLMSEIYRVENPENSDGLRVAHLSKQFGKFVAVEDVSFSVARGACFALLGPNGSGKSTTFNMIRGEIAPSGGNVFVENVSVSSNRAHARTHLGVCPQFDAIDQMNVGETMAFYARLRGLRAADVKHNVDEIVRAVGLSRSRTRMAAKLSGGNRRKLSLGIALMANPTVLLLDEPSSGMDAASKRLMWRTLAHVAGERSILLTTHSMEEADALASRAGILAKNLLAVGSSDRLKARWAEDTFVGHKVHVEDIMYNGQVKLAVQTRGEKQILSVVQIFKAVEQDKEKFGIMYYLVSQASLEQVFLKIVGEHDVAEEGYDS